MTATNVTIGPTTLTCEIWSTAGICGLLPDETQACALVKLVTADCACVPLPDIQSPTESPVATTIVGDRDNIFQESQRVADSASMFCGTLELDCRSDCGCVLRLAPLGNMTLYYGGKEVYLQKPKFLFSGEKRHKNTLPSIYLNDQYIVAKERPARHCESSTRIILVSLQCNINMVLFTWRPLLVSTTTWE